MIRVSLLPLLVLLAGGVSHTAPIAPLSPGAEAPLVAPASDRTPDWLTVDAEAKSIHIALEAGQTDKANYWNFNGYNAGEATISVPAGYTVTIAFKNSDPVMVHSAAVVARSDEMPAMFDASVVAFEGAATSNPTDMVKATATGASEEITFVASEAGEYMIACLIPGHAAVGMWVGFTVTDGGEAGVSLPE